MRLCKYTITGFYWDTIIFEGESPVLFFPPESSIRCFKTVLELTLDCHYHVLEHMDSTNIWIFKSLPPSRLYSLTKAVTNSFKSCGSRQFRVSLLDHAWQTRWRENGRPWSACLFYSHEMQSWRIVGLGERSRVCCCKDSVDCWSLIPRRWIARLTAGSGDRFCNSGGSGVSGGCTSLATLSFGCRRRGKWFSTRNARNVVNVPCSVPKCDFGTENAPE